MNFTPIAKPYLSCRVKQISKYAYSTERIQREVLKRLIGTASATEWGIRHSYSAHIFKVDITDDRKIIPCNHADRVIGPVFRLLKLIILGKFDKLPDRFPDVKR